MRVAHDSGRKADPAVSGRVKESEEESLDLTGFEAAALMGFSLPTIAVNFVPHCSQKLLAAGFFAPHLLQTFDSAIRKLLSNESDGKEGMTAKTLQISFNYTQLWT